MPWTSEHLKWLTDTGERLTTSSGEPIEVWEFCCPDDDRVLSSWAKHYRNHYCRDEDIDTVIEGTDFLNGDKPRRDYLVRIKFPDANATPGPSTRSGDFGEILIADYVQYVLKFWVPRTRFSDRVNRNDPTKGVDVIGLRLVEEGKWSPLDTLLLFESKCDLSGPLRKDARRLQAAVDDSAKDYQRRKAESLYAIKQWFLARGDKQSAQRITRFQNVSARPYEEMSGAAAVRCPEAFDVEELESTNAAEHPNRKRLMLLVIRGHRMMEIVNELYRRAADEA